VINLEELFSLLSFDSNVCGQKCWNLEYLLHCCELIDILFSLEVVKEVLDLTRSLAQNLGVFQHQRANQLRFEAVLVLQKR